MMVAEGQLAGTNRVAGGKHFGALGRGALVGALEPAERKIDPLARRLALDRGEALGDDQLVGHAKQRVEQAGAARVRIFLDPDDAAEAAAGGPARLQRIEPEAHARVRDVLPEVGFRRRHQDRPHLAIVEGRQEFERFRIDPGLVLVGAEHADTVGLKRRTKRGGRGIEFQRLGSRRRADLLARAQLAEPLGKAGLPPRGTDDDRQELLVEEQPALGQLLGPPAIELGGEGIGARRTKVHLDPAADKVMVQHRLGVEGAAQQHVANAQHMVEDVVVLGLEREAGEPHRAHQRAVAQPQRRRIDVAGIGQSVAGAGFLLVPCCRSEPFGHVLQAFLDRFRFTGRNCCSPTASNF